MTTREKMLAIGAGGLVLLVGAVSLVRSNIIEPLDQKRKLVQSLKVREGRLVGELATKPAVDMDWRKKLGHSIGTDPARALLAFREDVHGMLVQSGLTIGAVQPRQVREFKSGFREGFVELPLSINAEGTLQQVVAFLRAYYQKPYFARIESMSLTPETIAVKPGKNNDADVEPRLNVSMSVTALMLPKRFGPNEGPIPPGEDERLLKEEELAAFDEIHRTNLFKLYVPPKVVVKAPENPKTDEPKEVKPPAPPVKRPDADKLKLVGMNSHWPNIYVYVADERKKAEPFQRFKQNDPIDDGRLLMAYPSYPSGMVVRVKNDDGEGYVDYFYGVGKTFKERVPLDPQKHAAVVQELKSHLPSSG